MADSRILHLQLHNVVVHHEAAADVVVLLGNDLEALAEIDLVGVAIVAVNRQIDGLLALLVAYLADYIQPDREKSLATIWFQNIELTQKQSLALRLHTEIGQYIAILLENKG